MSGKERPVSGRDRPVSGKERPVSGKERPVSGTAASDTSQNEWDSSNTPMNRLRQRLEARRAALYPSALPEAVPLVELSDLSDEDVDTVRQVKWEKAARFEDAMQSRYTRWVRGGGEGGRWGLRTRCSPDTRRGRGALGFEDTRGGGGGTV